MTLCTTLSGVIFSIHRPTVQTNVSELYFNSCNTCNRQQRHTSVEILGRNILLKLRFPCVCTGWQPCCPACTLFFSEPFRATAAYTVFWEVILISSLHWVVHVNVLHNSQAVISKYFRILFYSSWSCEVIKLGSISECIIKSSSFGFIMSCILI